MGKATKKTERRREKKLSGITDHSMITRRRGEEYYVGSTSSFFDPAHSFRKVVQEKIDREMQSSQCRSIPVGDRKPPPLTPLELKRFIAVIKMRKYWKVVPRVNFLRDCLRTSKRFLLTEAQCDAILKFFNKLEGKDEIKKKK